MVATFCHRMSSPAPDPSLRPVRGAVFLSYASQDVVAALRIAETLRAAGIEVWFDQNELVGGDAWDGKIRGQIKECALFVPVISAATQARKEGYFRLEWHLAEQRSLLIAKGQPFIVPVTIDTTTERGAIVPEAFLAVQWTRLPGGEVPTAFGQRVRQLLGGEAGLEAGRPGPARHDEGVVSPAKVGRALRARLLWSVGALLGILIGIFGWSRLRPVGDAPSEKAARRSAPPTAEKTAASAVSQKSIAVLPFLNLGADKADEYLGDGMTEELLNVLAKVKGLRVPGRTSSFAFKGKMEEGIFRKVGEQLRVATVLEGSVRKVGEKLRITAQLINVADGYHLWSETYDRDMKDILAVQSDVAQRVVKALQIHLGIEETRALAKLPTESAEAHRLYLLGRFHFGKGTQEGWAEALRFFNDALRLDPGYALTYCGLADTYGWMGGNVLPGREAWAKEKEMAQKALALDPQLADAHLSLGIALIGSYSWRDSEAALRHAIDLNPNLALAHDQLWWTLAMQGRHTEGHPHTLRAIELEPLSTIISNNRAWGLYMAHRYDEAITQARRTMELQPNDANSHSTVGLALFFKGNGAEAVVELRKARKLDDIPWFIGSLGFALAASGDRAGAEQVLRDVEEMAKRRFVNAGVRAQIFLGLGEKARALDWLEKGYEEQDGICWNLKMDPIFDGVRDEPRFQALLKKVGFDR
ncbi:MAG: TIR domain-containing protein [Opitutus sp.]|nr:TIR domain-containing protein [Opitutus sp.]